jgi:hypothetical protein
MGPVLQPFLQVAAGRLPLCAPGRLDGAERETCASPDLMRLTAEVDRTTARLESALTSRDEALIDTEGPFRVS